MFVALLSPGCDRVLFRVVEPGVKENAFAMHLQIGDISVPIGDCSPSSGPGMVVYPCQTERRWIEGSRGFAIGTEGFTIEIEFGIELTGSPGFDCFLHLPFGNFEHFCESAQVRSEGDDRSNIKVS